MDEFLLTLADPDFYVSPDDAGSPLRPDPMCPEWTESRDGPWVCWAPPTTPRTSPPSTPPHAAHRLDVTTLPDRARYTLDRVAAACVELGVPFRHLATDVLVRALLDRAAPRDLAGRFATAYPADPATARELARELAADLAGERGPHLLTHRRHAGTVVQHPDPGHPAAGGPLAGRYQVTATYGQTAAGGTYLAHDLCTGEPVLVKEARAHVGFDRHGRSARQRLRHEHRTLVRVAERDPGLCPRPIDHFSLWEHDFGVQELITGHPLLNWTAINGVLYRLSAPPARRAAYLDRCARLLDALRALLARLRAVGLRLGALDHRSVVVSEDVPRLVGFGYATELDEPALAGTYPLPPDLAAAGVSADDYGLAAVAMFLLFPFHRPLVADPAGRLDLLRRDLGPVPAPLWTEATRFYRDTGPAAGLPTAAELDERPRESLRRLADGLVDGLLSDADPERPHWVFPPPPEAYRVNQHCLAHGTAGVLHALHHAGAAIGDPLRERFRRDVTTAEGLPSGLQDGAAGIALVLAELGDHDLAHTMITRALREPPPTSGLWHGTAGVGLAALRVAAHLADESLVSQAERLADHAALTGDAGLAHGRSGVALFLHELGRRTGERRHTDAALAALHAELDLATADDAELVFTDRGGRRIVAYLAVGSAGVAVALTRLVADTADERCAEALPRVLAACRSTSSVLPGLYQGAASWTWAAATHAAHSGDHATAVRIATGLAKYAIRGPGGLRVLGALETRFHADLASGGAGVLLAVSRVLGLGGQPAHRKERSDDARDPGPAGHPRT